MQEDLPQLLRACLQRDARAERALYRRFAGRVLTLCRRYARDDHEAQEFLQECWILLFNKLNRFDPARGSFEPWLLRVCTNCVLDELRRRQRQPHTVELATSLTEPPDEATDPIFERYPPETLLSAIQQLPDGYRQVLNLAVFEGWRHQRISERLGISAASSRSQLTRAKQALRKLLLQQTSITNAIGRSQ